MIRTPALCDSCRHLDRLDHAEHHMGLVDAQEPWKCAAFPYGIPQEIMPGGGDHRQPVEGDGGITYELMLGQHRQLKIWRELRGEAT